VVGRGVGCKFMWGCILVGVCKVICVGGTVCERDANNYFFEIKLLTDVYSRSSRRPINNGLTTTTHDHETRLTSSHKATNSET